MRRLLALLAVVGMLAAASPSLAQTPAADTITTPSVPTPGTFVDVLASPAPGARRGCVITNIGTTGGYCQYHPSGFTPTTSNTIPVPANGGQWLCSPGGGNSNVGQEAVTCTCASGTCAFVVNAQ